MKFLTLHILLALSFALVLNPSSANAYSCARVFKVHASGTNFLTWAQETREFIKTVNHDKETHTYEHFNIPVPLDIVPRQVKPLSAVAKKRIETTTDLYKKTIGDDTVKSLMWTGIESGNPLTRHEDYRWDSLRDQGLYERENRLKLIKSLNDSGVVNVRFGLSNDKIDADLTGPAAEKSWAPYDAMINDLHAGGLRVSLDMHHFGIEDRFRVVDPVTKRTVGEKSYYLNEKWPAYFAKYARKAYQRYHGKIKMITLMNEPETVTGFNGEMWHGGFPGWGHPKGNFYYIERAFQVAKASVLARTEIEAVAKQNGERPLYMHTEASVHKGYWNDFNQFIRFMVSDLILGNDWFMRINTQHLATLPMDQIVGRWHRKAPEQRTSYDWLIENYIVYNQEPASREAVRARLVQLIEELQSHHRALKTRFKKSMRTDTVFAVDYYAHNEDKSANGERLDPRPELYADQVRAGKRAGLYPVLIDYFNHFQMPLMIGESGTPYHHYGSRWNQQMLLESASAALAGIPFLGYTVYPAVDTWGWESALSVPRENTIFNPSGMLWYDVGVDWTKTDVPNETQHPPYAPKDFVKNLMDALKSKMPLE